MPEKVNEKISTKEILIFSVVVLVGIVIYLLLFRSPAQRGVDVGQQTAETPRVETPQVQAPPAESPQPAASSAAPPDTSAQQGGTNVNTANAPTEPTAPPVQPDIKQFWITKAVYSRSKGTVDVTVVNWVGTDYELERIIVLYGPGPSENTFEEWVKAMQALPSEKIGYVMKDKEQKTFTVRATQLPREIWAVPATHASVATVIQSDIQVVS
jgi:hypothetical protein